MKYTSSARKPARETTHTSGADASAGPNGVAIAPPDYGIGVVDRGPVAEGSEQVSKMLESTIWPVREGTIQREESAPGEGSGRSGVHYQKKPGLPDGLKAGVESLSGMAMDDVKVHYNSTKPARLQALAYTQGRDIHVGPSQERHLPHEAWHVVQQSQGRVAPSIQMEGVGVNIDPGLEHEADIMGERASNLSSVASRLPSASQSEQSGELLGQRSSTSQRVVSGSPVRQFFWGNAPQPDKQPWFHGWTAAHKKSKVPLTKREQTLLEGLNRGDIIDVELATDMVQSKKIAKTETIKVQEYIIGDVSEWYYSVVPKAFLDNILAEGLDPSYGGSGEASRGQLIGWNSRDHVYFYVEKDHATGYWKTRGKKDFTIVKFKLPKGTKVTGDPETRGNECRTKAYIHNVVEA